MKIFRLALLLLLSFLLLTSCVSSSGRAPKVASGAKIEILVLSDRGDTAIVKDYNPKTVGIYNPIVNPGIGAEVVDELAPFMEKDLILQLNRAGYQAKQIREKSEFTPGNGRYLLTTRITNYNPGSAAARRFVGFGAGAASLDNHYELFGNDAQPLLSWDDGVGTSEHWSKLYRRLNGNAVKRINDQLAKP